MGGRLQLGSKQNGFTIVELLIVIIVIAILAAITLVVYNGVQARAENTKTIQAVGTYLKGVRLYASDNGKFPIQAGFPCLGVASETCGTSAPHCWGIGAVTGQASFVSNLTTYFSQMPALSTQTMACDGSGTISKGGFYYSADGITAWIYYFLRGDVDCGTPGGLAMIKMQAYDTTYCHASFTY